MPPPQFFLRRFPNTFCHQLRRSRHPGFPGKILTSGSSCIMLIATNAGEWAWRIARISGLLSYTPLCILNSRDGFACPHISPFSMLRYFFQNVTSTLLSKKIRLKTYIGMNTNKSILFPLQQRDAAPYLKFNGHLKIPIFSGSILKSLFPFFNWEHMGNYAIGFQLAVSNIFNHKRITIGA